MPKVNIPLGEGDGKDYSAESLRLNELIYKADRSISGQVQWISTSSNTTYNTADFPDDPDIFDKGELGLIKLFWKQLGGENGFLLMADDYNNLVTKTETVALQADGWVDTPTQTVFKQDYKNQNIHKNSKVNLETTYNEVVAHINEPYVQIFVDNIIDGGLTFYCVTSTKPASIYNLILNITG